ncbi:putative succinylglutamate-semialdehyde dehydrogenase [Bacteriovorax sp. BSW11_IV]|uniref:aldehyde dehydrogenase family protein n=1 Tax=Bacteriovorax sp. BSW11_IV TaxID=1353529 RepID=UPI000389F58D|nr:aldehyde dehydrogenase family protein [Bacteriovorax sp. BSW11_IV]EQC45132.1 putative succinylglutamate-semialdehyde dehydrogenase [Bacteriovorax sp. BSW11_IV]
MELKGNYYNGEFHPNLGKGSSSTQLFVERECPSDLSLTLWRCPIEYQDVDHVVESAINGFNVWRKTPLEERIAIFGRYKAALLEKKEEISRAIALEVGKPLWEARTEAQSLIGKVDVTINDSLPRINKKHFPEIMPHTHGHIFFKPIGPSLIIGPFNFPCHLANGQILSALIAGNSIIFKPSEKTCYSAQLMFECLAQAGFPTGVVNLIQGDGEVARRILKEKAIKGVFFTGSKEVGLRILEQTHKDLGKLVCLELGGKNPSIIHKDTDIDHALAEIIKGSFLTTGQRCTSTAITVIHNDIKDEFIDKFHALAKRIIVDDPMNEEVLPFMGPLIDQRSLDQYLLFQGMAKREGIEEIMRGKQLERSKKGYYVSPSIHLAKAWDNKSHFLQSEIFGPNNTFVPYTDIEEAITIANSTEYGLAASIFTKDNAIFEKCVMDIDAGLVNRNRSTVGASAKLPFGGVKNSGNYHPAAVTTIDACVYQLSSLEIENDFVEDFNTITGLMK